MDAQPCNILIIDDFSIDRETYCRYLQSDPEFSYRCLEAASATAGLQLCHSHPINCILLDFNLPDLNGLEFLSQLQLELQESMPPVVVITGEADPTVAVQVMKHGAEDYLIKSQLTPEQLQLTMHSAIENAQLRQQLQQLEFEHQQTEAAMAEQNAHIRLLYETTRDLLSTEQPLALVDSLFTKLQSLMGMEVYFNYLIDEQQQKLRLTFYGGISDRLAEEIKWLEIGKAICGTVAQQRCQIVQPDLQHSTHPQADLVRSLGLTAYSCQPLIAQGKLFGTLGFGSYHRTHFSTAEVNLLQVLCDQIAVALERAELVSSLQHQTGELKRANRVKDEFLAVLSHELRTPLNPILAWSQMLQHRKFSQDKLAIGLETIERNAKLQAQLIDDLLDVARILRDKLVLNPVPLDLGRVIDAAIETVQPTAVAKSVGIEKHFSPAGQVAGDAARLQQVVWNLLTNAVKFVPAGGRVQIGLSQVGDRIQIQVKDNGKGIRPDFLPYVFESFRQADASTTRTFGGLGLGLAIVRQIVEMHGGTITADSEGEGQGATFTVLLPMLHAYTEIAVDTTPAPTVPDLQGIRILVVDDEPDTRTLLKFMLETYGAEVVTADSTQSALKILPSFHPNILVSDIGMPGEDGYQLIQRVRSLSADQDSQMPAIALTAYAGEINQQQSLEAGFQLHINKPVEPLQLVQAIAALVQIDRSQ